MAEQRLGVILSGKLLFSATKKRQLWKPDCPRSVKETVHKRKRTRIQILSEVEVINFSLTALRKA